ncbi:MAG: restriction endonuclease subunit S [Tissierellia bacterium]|nr:restriction endonuclease subunit S [Tissierellia bacterium]
MPFDIPDNWEWVRLSEVSFNVGGVQNKILQRDILEKGEIPVISQSQSLIEGYSNDKDKILENPGELIVFGDHSKTLKYIDFDFIIGADGTRILCPFEISGRYLYYSIQLLIVDLITQNYGRHYKFIKDAFISLPPLAEQKRIVEKLDKILLILEGIE